jgi:RNA polymerase-binding transcription factor DksA
MLSKEFIEHNKKMLIVVKSRIETILNRKDLKDGAGEFPGEFKPKFDELGNEDGENASEVEKFSNELGVTLNLEARLKEIDAALKRIENGTYGKCTEGDEIDEARLRAMPTAETCISHSK